MYHVVLYLEYCVWSIVINVYMHYTTTRLHTLYTLYGRMDSMDCMDVWTVWTGIRTTGWFVPVL